MRIEIIEWVDTFGCSSGWEFEEEMECRVVKVKSVGFVLKETEEVVVLVPHISNAERRQVAGYINIPVRQIVRRKELL